MSWRHVWSRSVTCNFTTVIYMRARLQINSKPSMGLLNTTRSRQNPRRNDIKGSIWPTSERGKKGILDRVFRVLTPSLFCHPKWRSQKVWVFIVASARAWTCLFLSFNRSKQSSRSLMQWLLTTQRSWTSDWCLGRAVTRLRWTTQVCTIRSLHATIIINEVRASVRG